MLVSGCLLLVRSFPTLQIPNLETAAAADERNLAFEAGFLAKIIRQNEPALAVGGGVLRARMQLAQKNAAIARGDIGRFLGGRTHAREFLR